MNVDSRRNVRVNLHAHVILQGTDRFGKPFQVQGESVDFSRKGLGLLVPENLVGPGSVVTLSVPKKFRGDAVVQWTRHDAETGKVRVGCSMISPKATLFFRIVASLLLCVAFAGQVSFARSRHAQANSSCTMGLARMKSILEGKFGEWTTTTNSEKTFIHIMHQQRSCDEYTRLYEKSNFYGDQNKCAAVSRWHWNHYHAKDESTRTAAVSGLDPAVAAGD